MDLEKGFHRNRGTGEYSYAQNSHIQKQCLDNVMPITQEAAIKMLSTDFPNIIRIADMGCSSGPNTFSVLNTIIHAICLRYQEVSRKIPEFSIFRQLPSFYELMKEKEERVCDSCFVAGVPGSFYRRLFPANSLHFVHSSYSLQWLSKASSNSLYDEEGFSFNRGKVYISETSTSCVAQSYSLQFQEDSSSFLSCRSKELLMGGRLLLIFPKRDGVLNDKKGVFIWEALGEALQVVLNEEKLGHHGRDIAMTIRAAVESMITCHFGPEIMDDLFLKYADIFNKKLSFNELKPTDFVIVLRKSA
ncbi:hypothetical protein AMTRI_Chr03g49660 [Amborella trichopoda]